jgi:transcription termination factor Rho
VTDTTQLATSPGSAGESNGDTGSRNGSLTALRLPQLQAIASDLGLSGTAKMRKSDLVAAITARRSGGGSPSRDSSSAPAARRATSMTRAPEQSSAPVASSAPVETAPPASTQPASTQPASSEPAGSESAGQHNAGQQNSAQQTVEHGADAGDGAQRREPRQRNRQDGRQGQNDRQNERQGQNGNRSENRPDNRQGQSNDRQSNDRQSNDRQSNDRQSNDRQSNDRQNDRQNQGPRHDDDGDDGNRRGRRNRYRDRKRRGRNDLPPGQYDEPEITEDDVLAPVAGILDVLDNYAFVRTSGYLPGPNDVYVSLGQVKKSGLRKGDAVTGAVRAPHEGEQQNQRQKFNALVRLDTVNGMTPEEAKARVEFSKLTPLYPQERLRLETEPGILTTRIIDLVAPIGKGQRGLIVSPAKAGKTLILQAIANSISTNNPECHLMVVLVDERPEEVTDMQRAIKGEVIASTFDRPADDHTTVAELAIERAKRLVEMGHDVVVLLDSITRLGRAYNLAAPASGRILSGGVDSSALYPPKRFFGAARNVENGGSLTIIATALIDTGSKMDEVIFEEFKGTGNMELRLDRRLADKRLFPAVDVNPSGTRREEILLGREELSVSWKLRRVLTALDSQQALELMLDRLRKTSSNAEFLMQVQKTSPSVPGQSDDD